MKNYTVIGNLKMNVPTNINKYFKYINKVAAKSKAVVGLAVPSVYLPLASKTCSNILFGTQNVYFEPKGAYTGELSVSMLNDFDARICIVGHSERRTKFGETDADVHAKICALLDAGVTPVLCVGESLDVRNDGKFVKFVRNQLKAALNGLTKEQASEVIVAYEPIWAIGTGVTATVEQIDEVCANIKSIVNKAFGVEPKVLYGGSVNEKNSAEIMQIPSVNGCLVGGACLDEYKFEKIIQSCK